GADFLAGASHCALPDSCAANARRCAESFGGPPGALPATAHVCSGMADGHGELRLEVAQPADVIAVALVRRRKTMRRPTKQRLTYKVGLSSHTLFSSQAINSSRSATTS